MAATDEERSARWQARRADLGARIRQLREDAQLTQEALSLESGVARTFLIEVEWGRRGIQIERLYDLADVLGVPIADLLEPPTRPPTRSLHRGGRRRLADT